MNVEVNNKDMLNVLKVYSHSFLILRLFFLVDDLDFTQPSLCCMTTISCVRYLCPAISTSVLISHSNKFGSVLDCRIVAVE